MSSSARARDVVLCSVPDCPRAAAYGPWCVNHRGLSTAAPLPPGVVLVELNDDETARLAAKVDADAAPLFLAAMGWIVAEQLRRIPAALPAGDTQ